jgi:hypothetical protein
MSSTSRRYRARNGGRDRWPHISDKKRKPTLTPRGRVVGSSAGVRDHEAIDPSRVSEPEAEGNVAAHRQSTEAGTIDPETIEQIAEIVHEEFLGVCPGVIRRA